MNLGPRKPVFGSLRTTQDADQPAHLRRLISAFIIHFSESIIRKLATGEISIFYLVSVAKKNDLKLALWETPKTGFLAGRPKWDQSWKNFVKEFSITPPQQKLGFTLFSFQPRERGK